MTSVDFSRLISKAEHRLSVGPVSFLIHYFISPKHYWFGSDLSAEQRGGTLEGRSEILTKHGSVTRSPPTTHTLREGKVISLPEFDLCGSKQCENSNPAMGFLPLFKPFHGSDFEDHERAQMLKASQ